MSQDRASRLRLRVSHIPGRSGDRLRVAAAAMLAAVSLLAVLGSGAVAAPPSGTISRFAGGVGGPAKGPAVAIKPSAVAAGGGSLYIADVAGNAVRAISATTGTLTTLAGVGIAGGAGDNVTSTAAPLSPPMGAAIDTHGNVLIGDAGDPSVCAACGNVVRVAAKTTGTFYGRSMTAGHLYIIAGQVGQDAFGGDGGPATSALLYEPGGVAVDAAGDVAIIDSGNDRIRLIPAANATYFAQTNLTKGDIYTLAGNGVRSYFGDGGFAWNSLLNVDRNSAIAFDGAGNLIFTDTGNDVVRIIAASTGTFYGRAMTEGFIYPFAGDAISGYSGDGGAATAAQLSSPVGIALDAKGSIVIGDGGNNVVRVVANATGTSYGRSMTADHIYTIAGTFAISGSFSGDAGPATAAHFSYPSGVAVDAAGNVAIADQLNDRVRVVAAKTGTAYGRSMIAGHVYTVAGDGSETFSGDGGPAAAAQMDNLTGAVVDHGGNLIVADAWNERLRIIPTKTGTYYGRALKAGTMYTLAGTGTEGSSGDKGPAAKAKIGLENHFNGVGDFVDYATGMAVDSHGNLIFADTDSHRLRVIAAKTGTFYGQSMHVGDIYTVAGNGTFGYSGDGGLATKAAIREPDGVALDSSGNIFLTDVDGLSNAVRMMAEKTGTYYGQSMTKGHIYSLIGKHCTGSNPGDGGLASNACLDWPTSVAVDAKGNVLVTEPRNQAVRLVAATAGTYYGHAVSAAHITTISSGVNAQAVTMDHHGNVLIASDRLRVIAGSTATFYGQAMTIGHAYAIAGNGSPGISGDGGPAVNAELSPAAIAVAGNGDLFVADSYARRIRMVAH